MYSGNLVMAHCYVCDKDTHYMQPAFITLNPSTSSYSRLNYEKKDDHVVLLLRITVVRFTCHDLYTLILTRTLGNHTRLERWAIHLPSQIDMLGTPPAIAGVGGYPGRSNVCPRCSRSPSSYQGSRRASEPFYSYLLHVLSQRIHS